MPRTKGSKNRPKTNITKDYASQIAEKQESIVFLTAEIASITANIETLKADLKVKKSDLKKAEKEVASPWKQRRQRQMLRLQKKRKSRKPRLWLRSCWLVA